MRALIRTVVVVAAVVVAASVVPPAHAEPRVDVANQDGQAAVDPAYVTSLTLRGSGFQSIQGGHGGIYVFFGTVRAGWRPSQGGQTGVDYFYVPDGESRDNQGYARFVAFPGSDTAGSANGGTISGSGAWSTTLRVPGATFEAYDRHGGSRTVDCRQVTCGIITVGAHGVTNARNESFTPVRVEDLYATGEEPPATEVVPAPGADAPAPAAQAAQGKGRSKGRSASVTPTLDVDRGAAHAGHVLSFAAAGLPPGTQVTTVLDDGVAGAGPFLVGDDGRVAGVLTLPADLQAGTHELRLFGVDGAPSVSFGVSDNGEVQAAAATVPTAEQPDDRVARALVVVAGLLLVLAVARLLLVRRRGRHG